MKYIFLIWCVAMMGCNDDSSTVTPTNATDTLGTARIQTDTAAQIVLPACYVHETSNNQILLELTTLQPAVTGRLTYDFLGKDKNEGSISGKLSGDTLRAFFHFELQGKQLVREVAFLRKGDGFTEGTAEPAQKGDTIKFSRTDSLTFNGALLKSSPCPGRQVSP